MNNLRKLLASVNGATFININTSTEPKLTGGKSNPHKGRVRKVTTGANVMVFQNKSVNGYEAMVKRRLEKEGKAPESFELSPRKWGTRLPNTPIVEHKGNYYLEVIFLHKGKTHYELDGVKTDPSNIQGLPGYNGEAEQGGLNDKVVIRTFKIDSLTSITINKETYTDLYYLEKGRKVRCGEIKCNGACITQQGAHNERADFCPFGALPRI